MTSLTPPSLVVRQLFARGPISTGRRLLPYLFGSLAYSLRYDKAEERPLGYVGQYDDAPAVVSGVAQSLYPWPDLPVGNTVELESARLFVEAAVCRYFADTTTVSIQKKASNQVRLPNTVLKTAAGSTSNVLDAGVAIGDLVRITGVVSSVPFTLGSYVTGLIGDAVAAAVGPVESASTNKATTVAGAVVTAGGSNTGDQSAAASAAAYNGHMVGLATETYVVTVTLGGAANTAKFSVTSASGTDDVNDVVITSLGSAVPFGIRGMTVTFTNVSSATFTAGDTWSIAVTAAYTVPVLTVAGTYTGVKDRRYIVEVTDGYRTLTGGFAKISVASQDGTDTGVPISIPSSSPVALGSYGLTVSFAAAAGLMKGDKWLITVTAASEGVVRTLVLAHDLPSNVPLNTNTGLTVEFFKQLSVEVPHRSGTVGVYNYTAEATQLRVRGDVYISKSDVMLNGAVVPMELKSVAEFADTNRLYVQYRAWYPAFTDLVAIDGRAALDDVLLGPNDPDNPLKHAVTLCRLGAGGETIYAYNVGDPTSLTGWQRALSLAASSEAPYGYVPLTNDIDVLTLTNAAIQTANGEMDNSYRVAWFSSPRVTGGVVVDATLTDDETTALAVVEDNNAATGTQYTQLRLTSANADFIELGVRPGDKVRYLYTVNGWGDETYTEHVVSSVRSATVLVLATALSGAEVLAKRFEIHRTYEASELRDHYAAEASRWGSDLIRHVLAPEVEIGSYTLPGYFIATIVAGMRASAVPQQLLSTVQIPGVLQVRGLELFSYADLNILAGAGCFICIYDSKLAAVKVRHAITTGETEILSKREESKVSARHAALFVINDRLASYVGQANMGDDDQFGRLAEQIRGDLVSVGKQLQATDFTTQFGGLISELIINSIERSALAQDEMLIDGQLDVGDPLNKITFRVTV